jgi:hypothetical protein
VTADADVERCVNPSKEISESDSTFKKSVRVNLGPMSPEAFSRRMEW